MKKIVLKNKKEYVFSDASTELDLTTVLDTFGEVDSIREDFTVDNVRGAKYERATMTYIVPDHVIAKALPNGKVEVHFVNREMSEEEKQNEKIAELQETVATLM